MRSLLDAACTFHECSIDDKDRWRVGGETDNGTAGALTGDETVNNVKGNKNNVAVLTTLRFDTTSDDMWRRADGDKDDEVQRINCRFSID